MKRLTNAEGAEEARRLLDARLGAHGLWLLREGRDERG